VHKFFVFKSKEYHKAHIAKYEVGVKMGMQMNAWMIGHLFEKWLSHFIDHLERRRGISPSN
jgi:hypothetical protein